MYKGNPEKSSVAFISLTVLMFSFAACDCNNGIEIQDTEIRDRTIWHIKNSSDSEVAEIYTDIELKDIKYTGIDLCIPDCSNKECGEDGCGGSCGLCGENASCLNNICVCNFGYADCDKLISNGCKTDLNSPSTCGTTCDNITSCGPNSVCNLGICECKSGYSNCNGDLIDGCEKTTDLQHIWGKGFGESFGEYIHYGIAVDSSNNVYIVGDFSSPAIDFVGGPLQNAGGNCGEFRCSDIFLAKFDSNGNHLWSKRFGGDNYDHGYSIAIDNSNNIYITGYFGSTYIDFGGGSLINIGNSCNNKPCCDIYIAKFDKDGNHLWSKRFGGDSFDEAYSLAVDNSGNVYITGWFGSPYIDFGGDNTNRNCGGRLCSNTFVVKLDSNGNYIWVKKFSGTRGSSGTSLATDSKENLYVVGEFYGSTLDFDGDVIINTGNDCSGNSCGDIFLAKLDRNENLLWGKGFGGIHRDYGVSVSVDKSDNVYITGYFDSPEINFGGDNLINVSSICTDTLCSDMFLAKFDSDGNHLWSKSFGGSAGDYGTTISFDRSDNIYLGGAFNSPEIYFGNIRLINKGGNCGSYPCFNSFLSKFDSNGNIIWSKSFGENNYSEIDSVRLDISDNIYMVGRFAGNSIDFGGCSLVNAGYSDIFLVKYSP